jgi:MinD-like ATPase involved in chromosome partitioning or flagellar assembly
MNVPFLGTFRSTSRSDRRRHGIPICVGEPKSPAAQSFRSAAEQLATQLSVLSMKQEKRPIPLTQVR